MPERVSESKPNGFTMKCRACDNPIYLHSGMGGRWRAYEPARANAEPDEWNRHRCTAALQDAEIMNLVAPAGSKPVDLVPRMHLLVRDLQSFIKQAEARETEQAALRAAEATLKAAEAPLKAAEAPAVKRP